MKPDDIDPAAFLQALNAVRLRWLLIGRQALIHYGAPLQTMDYDLWIDPAKRNVDRLLKISDRLGLETPPNYASVAHRPCFSLFGGLLKIDVFKVKRFTNLEGKTLDFACAYRRRVVAASEGDPLKIPLPALADLRILKKMRTSEKDREDLRYLDLLEP
jgi:hypothetical protein